MMGPKEKKERALGEHLQLKAFRSASPKGALTRKPYRPGVHGKSRQRALSDFGRQIKEKQKFKLSYGVDERNLRQIFKRAEERAGSTAENLIQLVEGRLDNVVYRLGFAGSRSMARQFVVHGHITVNKRIVRAPGFVVRPKDIISIRPESVAKTSFKELRENLLKYAAPVWLKLDVAKLEGSVLSAPKDIETPFEINVLVESFSK